MPSFQSVFMVLGKNNFSSPASGLHTAESRFSGAHTGIVIYHNQPLCTSEFVQDETHDSLWRFFSFMQINKAALVLNLPFVSDVK